jgi:hypothetical protein
MDTKREGLELSANRKVTSISKVGIAGADDVRDEGLYYYPLEPNSFGLPCGETCPGSTGYCQTDCYADDLRLRHSTRKKLARNLELLRQQENLAGITFLVRGLVAEYNRRANLRDIDPNKRRFRIHWSGDFHSIDYTQAWRTVMKENPGIHFLTYTRSFGPEVNVLPILDGVDNLELFISVDKYNVDLASEAIKESPNTRVSYLVDYLEEVEELRAKMGRTEGFKSYACPEVMRKKDGSRMLPLISEKGGACSVCQYCMVRRGNNYDVVFVKTGQKQRNQYLLPYEEQLQIIKPERQVKVTQEIGAVALQHETLF